ncbi:MAG: hypothetical protein FWD31_05645, partial [Planctomycetaceae bacterium]|nr:hypothetical protein [Planctomycetaceae bacterium]
RQVLSLLPRLPIFSVWEYFVDHFREYFVAHFWVVSGGKNTPQSQAKYSHATQWGKPYLFC